MQQRESSQNGALDLELPQLIESIIEHVNKLDTEGNMEESLQKIKEGLKLCISEPSTGKYYEQEYRLFLKLGDIYSKGEDRLDYPNAIGIYQYLLKLIDKLPDKIEKEEKCKEVAGKIALTEEGFIKQARLDRKIPEGYIKKVSFNKIEEYKAELEKHRFSIGGRLEGIKDLGLNKAEVESNPVEQLLSLLLEKIDLGKLINPVNTQQIVEGTNLVIENYLDSLIDKDTLTQIREKFLQTKLLNYEELRQRALKIKEIYKDIKEFFIGSRDIKGEIEKTGLINKLVEDCIEELGGLPQIKGRDVVYSFFGMGSMGLGTMTPWSDMEWGIFIEEGLGEEEGKVKEYFRNLTALLHIKIIRFGESPLRMLGIKELNNFRKTDNNDSEHNWFYDRLIKSGFSFDGP
ncbi:hypothetical protein NF27_JJ00010, partial [Candidatus Jidaibacter acanthamoeba]